MHGSTLKQLKDKYCRFEQDPKLSGRDAWWDGLILDQSLLLKACHNALFSQREKGKKRPEVEEWWLDKLADPENLVDFAPNGCESHHAKMARAYVYCVQLIREHGQFTSGKISPKYLVKPSKELQLDMPQDDAISFLQDLCLLISGDGKPRKPQGHAFALFPSIDNYSGIVTITKFSLEKADCNVGSIFIAPEQAFLLIKGGFDKIFTQARKALKDMHFDPTFSARVWIMDYNDDSPWSIQSVEGQSAGGAFALALYGLYKKMPIESSFVTSFALAPTGESKSAEQRQENQAIKIGEHGIELSGEAFPIEGIVSKASALGEKHLIISKKQSEKLIGVIEKERVHCVEDVAQAIEIATGQLQLLMSYLQSVKDELKNVPEYYPKDNLDLGNFHVRVKMRSEPKKYLPKLKAINRDSVADERETFSHNGHGQPIYEDQDKYKILDWESEVRNNWKKGVILGNPGYGKSWHLKREAIKIAQEGLDKLVDEPNTDAIEIPIYLQLEDVAKKLRHGDINLGKAISKAISNQSSTKDFEKLLSKKIETGKVFLFLDALDEVSPKYRNILLNALNHWIPHIPFKVMLASRQDRYQPPWNISQNESDKEVELLPFEMSQSKEFIDHWFSNNESKRNSLNKLLDEAASTSLRKIAEVPLLLGFLCGMLHGG